MYNLDCNTDSISQFRNDAYILLYVVNQFKVRERMLPTSSITDFCFETKKFYIAALTDHRLTQNNTFDHSLTV